MRIDLTIGRIIGNHLPTPSEANDAAVVLAIVVLQLLAVPADAIQALDSTKDSVARLPTPAAQLYVVAARKIELRIVEPPRHVQVHATNAVFIVRHAICELRDVAADG